MIPFPALSHLPFPWSWMIILEDREARGTSCWPRGQQQSSHLQGYGRDRMWQQSHHKGARDRDTLDIAATFIHRCPQVIPRWPGILSLRTTNTWLQGCLFPWTLFQWCFTLRVMLQNRHGRHNFSVHVTGKVSKRQSHSTSSPPEKSMEYVRMDLYRIFLFPNEVIMELCDSSQWQIQWPYNNACSSSQAFGSFQPKWNYGTIK